LKPSAYTSKHMHPILYSVELKPMEPPERVETDQYVDNYVPVTEGDEQFAEAVGELPRDNGLNGQSDHGMPPEAGDGHNGPPNRAQLVWMHTSSRPLGTAMSPLLLDQSLTSLISTETACI